MKWSVFVEELKEHLPFTLVASLIAGVIVAIVFLMGIVSSQALLSPFFELLHSSHIFVSAIASSAIYYKYRKSIFEGLIVGVFSALLIGSLSDILFPWIAGNLFFLDTSFHLPLLESPVLIISIAFLGSLVGIYLGLFKLAHTLHVFLSIFASLFYILAFSQTVSFLIIIAISLIVFFAVFIPCCISDIILPLLFVDKPCEGCHHFG